MARHRDYADGYRQALKDMAIGVTLDRGDTNAKAQLDILWTWSGLYQATGYPKTNDDAVVAGGRNAKDLDAWPGAHLS